MIVYHGTTEKLGKQILKDGMIKKDIKRRYTNSCDMPTTNKYVYVTNDFTNAVYYGNKNAVFDKEKKLMVFKFNFEESMMEPDIDEINYTLVPFGNTRGITDINNPTLEESLKTTMAARIAHNIELKKYKVEYAIIESSFGNEPNNFKTHDLVSLTKTDNEYANKYKYEFFSEVKWIKCI